MNENGGSGQTTTTISLAAVLAEDDPDGMGPSTTALSSASSFSG
jgi:cellulose biosynthesis protein BcsQ